MHTRLTPLYALGDGSLTKCIYNGHVPFCTAVTVVRAEIVSFQRGDFVCACVTAVLTQPLTFPDHSRHSGASISDSKRLPETGRPSNLVFQMSLLHKKPERLQRWRSRRVIIWAKCDRTIVHNSIYVKRTEKSQNKISSSSQNKQSNEAPAKNLGTVI